jgi:RNase adaptor protein for sRNA GlmZ degradation
MKVVLETFGQKYGPLEGADVVVDVRQLRSPSKVLGSWRPVLTEAVMQFVVRDAWFLPLLNTIKTLIEREMMTGKKEIVVGIGCWNGRHRSVAMSYFVRDWVEGIGAEVEMRHRDRGREEA